MWIADGGERFLMKGLDNSRHSPVWFRPVSRPVGASAGRSAGLASSRI